MIVVVGLVYFQARCLVVACCDTEVDWGGRAGSRPHVSTPPANPLVCWDPCGTRNHAAAHASCHNGKSAMCNARPVAVPQQLRAYPLGGLLRSSSRPSGQSFARDRVLMQEAPGTVEKAEGQVW